MEQWIAMRELTFQNKYGSECGFLCKVLALAFSFDKLRVSNLACIECVGLTQTPRLYFKKKKR